MFKFNDIFLVIVGGYVIYKIGYVDGFTPVNLFILVCLTVAVISTALRRSGYADKMEERKNREAKRIGEERESSPAEEIITEKREDKKENQT